MQDNLSPKIRPMASNENSAVELAQGESSPTKRIKASNEDIPFEPTQRRVTPMNELLYGRKALAERATNPKVPRLSSLADAPHEEVSPPPSPAKDHPLTKSVTIDSVAVVRAHTAVTSPSKRQHDTSIEEYAAQDHSDRQAVLEEFMIANLENPAFTTLCEDVENCWRRMALGL